MADNSQATCLSFGFSSTNSLQGSCDHRFGTFLGKRAKFATNHDRVHGYLLTLAKAIRSLEIITKRGA